jgi:hypothetical protein
MSSTFEQIQVLDYQYEIRMQKNINNRKLKFQNRVCAHTHTHTLKLLIPLPKWKCNLQLQDVVARNHSYDKYHGIITSNYLSSLSSHI